MSTDRWVTFDCFGTLVDWRGGFAAVLTPLTGENTAAVLRAYHQIEPTVESETPHRFYRDVLATSLQRAAASVGVPLSDQQAGTLPQSWASLPVFADVEPMLATLRLAGYRLAVLTNCDEDLFEMTHRSFRQRFDLVVTAERVRDYKPSPAHFRYFSRSTGAEPGNWVHVACSWFHDIAPARELGIRRVWLDRDPPARTRRTATRRVRRPPTCRCRRRTVGTPWVRSTFARRRRTMPKGSSAC